MTLVITSIMGFVAISIWTEYFRFQAYGELTGTIVRLSTSATGSVRAIHVEEGDQVYPGQLLVELDVRDLEFQRQQLTYSLQLAISDLQVRLAEHGSRDRELRANEVDRQMRYYQLLGQFHQAKSDLENASAAFENSQRLSKAKAIAESELVESRTVYEGQKAKLADLADALQAFENASTLILTNGNTDDLLRAEKAKIETFQSEIKALDDLMYAKQIRAPVAGRILKRMAEPGEYLPANHQILELVEAGSVEAVVYFPQRRARVLAVGDEIRVQVTPTGRHQTFRVGRIAPDVVRAPQAIQSHYRAFKNLVRVYAQPTVTTPPGPSKELVDLTTLVGAELSLSSFGYRTKSRDPANQSAGFGPTEKYQVSAQTGGE